MSDHIKREDAIKTIEKITTGDINTIITDEAKRKAAEALFADIPSADVVEVVRCVDCVHGSYCEDVLWCNITYEPVWEDDYCSKGDRL